MLISAEQIRQMIPHVGAMVMLDAVTAWDANAITCISARHRDPGNPLRTGDGLGALNAVEFAAQAMALHGGLTRPEGQAAPKGGYLASLRGLSCTRARLDDLAGDLVIVAERLAGDAARVTYRFSVSCAAAEVLSGRATVILDAATL